MTRLRTGYKPSVGPILKIMKNDADDPFTTSNADHAKFIFNSETSKLSYLLGIHKFVFGGNGVYNSNGGTQFVPNVYNITPHYRVEAFRTGGNHRESHIFNPQGHYGLSYAPLTETRWRTTANSRIAGNVQVPSPSTTWFNNQPYEDNAVVNYSFESSPIWTMANPNFEGYLSVWELPAGNVAYTLPSGTPVAGQHVITIRPSRAALARPGYSLASTNPQHYVFDSNRVPAKILAAGEVSLPANGSADVIINAAFRPLSSYTYVDALTRFAGQTLLHPATLPYNFNWRAEGPTFDYQVMPDRVRFFSTGPAVVVRYLIGADDDQGNSAGSGRVVRAGDSPGFIQICRPNAAVPPNLKDILVDSRLPYLPIVADGWIPRSSINIATDDAALGTHRSADISWTNNGFLPFLKFTYGSAAPKTTRFFLTPDPSNRSQTHSNTSIVGRLTDTTLRFYASPGAVTTARWGGHDQGTPPNPPQYRETTATPPDGIRYYVFALPQ